VHPPVAAPLFQPPPLIPADAEVLLLTDGSANAATLLDAAAELSIRVTIDAIDHRLDLADWAPTTLVLVEASSPMEVALAKVGQIRSSSLAVVAACLAPADESVRVALLEAGADAVVPANCPPDEAVAWLCALLRRIPRAGRSSCTGEGAVILDLAAHEVLQDGHSVQCSNLELEVLLALHEANGATMTAEELLERAWPGADKTELGRVKSTIHRLRRRLGWSDQAPLETIRGVGYRLAVQACQVQGTPLPRHPSTSPER